MGKWLWILCLLLWGCSSAPVQAPLALEPIRTTPLPLAIAHAPLDEPDSGVINDGTFVPPPQSREADGPPPRTPEAEAPVPKPQAPPKVTAATAQPSYPKAKAKSPTRDKKSPEPLADLPPLPSGGSAGSLSEAEAASLRLDEMIGQGILQASYVGTGQHEMMVTLSLRNTSDKEVTIHLTPGMILNPGNNHKVQPLLVDDHAKLTLAPGETRSGDLFSYCMDSRVPAPRPNESIQYRFATRTKDGGPEAVRVMDAAKALLPAGPHRRAVTQLAIWKSLGQRIGDPQISSAMEPYSYDPRDRRAVLRDLDRVMKKAGLQ